MAVSDEEEKQEIELDDIIVDDLADIIVDDLADIAINEDLETPHDLDPEITPSEAKEDTTFTGTVAIDQESEGETPSKKGWSRVTLALVFAVVALTAALMITIPVLLTRDTSNDSSSKTTLLVQDTQFSDAGDRTNGTITDESQQDDTDTPPPSLVPTRAPVVSAPVSVAPNGGVRPISTFTSMPSTPGRNPAYQPPSWYTPSPSPDFYAPQYTTRPSSFWRPSAPFPSNNDQCDSNKIDCQGGPCGLVTIGGDEVKCCGDWLALDVLSGEKWESYCWASFALGAACYDSKQGDSMCQSGLCYAGVCANQRGAVGEICTHSRNCTNGCGQDTLGATSKRCCAYYESIYLNQSGVKISYCSNSFKVGEACLGSEQCDTNLCIQGKCALQRLDVGSPCSNYEECSEYACAIGVTNSTSLTMNTTSMVCCPSRSTYGFYNGSNYNNYVEYCSNVIPNGQQCLFDELCQSGICINETATTGLCNANRLPDGATCYSDNHCQNYGCGHASYPVAAGSNKTCCAKGWYEYLQDEITYEYAKVCARSIALGQPCSGQQSGDSLCETGVCVQDVCAEERLPNGEACDGYYDCKSGVCGLNASQYLSDSTSLCCDTTHGVYDGFSYDYLSFCIRTIPTGESCEFGYDGDDTSVLCESGICIQGTCTDEYLEDGENCNRNSECSSQACAFSDFDFADRERVCCVGDALYYYDAPFYNGENYCERSVPDGGRCPSDSNYNNYRVCESGICINELCTNERQEDGEGCQNGNDCQSQACGLDSVEFATRKNICCAAGERVYVFDGFDRDYYCVRNIPLGGQCLSSSQNSGGSSVAGLMCTTGICIDDVCVDARLEDAELCGTSDECDSDACGYNSMDFGTREKVCCESLCTNQLYDGFGYEDYCVGIQEVGEQCMWDNGRQNEIYPQLCGTGICVDEICSTELQGYQDTCDYGTDCIGGACGFTSFNMSSPKICCDRTYSIYDGICGYDEFCVGTFTFGQQCSYRGQRYGELCSSYSCMAAGTCSNDTMPCEEYGDDGAEGEGGGEGNNDDEDSGTDNGGNATWTNSTTKRGGSLVRHRKLEDVETDDEKPEAYPSSVPCN